jgi:hypothetical protein
MAVQGVLALGIVLIVVLLILIARARIDRARDDRNDAPRLIGEEIEAHIEALAAGYLEARSGRVGRPATDRSSVRRSSCSSAPCCGAAPSVANHGCGTRCARS